jgi:hypothetical protein
MVETDIFKVEKIGWQWYVLQLHIKGFWWFKEEVWVVRSSHRIEGSARRARASIHEAKY